MLIGSQDDHRVTFKGHLPILLPFQQPICRKYSITD